ncbi:MAG: insulinase family protein [Verrucomicrobia bacterium]|nr:insulinase family protein [Verrucomicrobiota bacterium]
MKLTRFLLVLLALAPAAFAQKVPVVERTLSNGMKLLMVERHDDPSIAGGWVAHVGSANERPGITGIAHLFEHMMFKGTPTLGTKDYKKDLEIIAEQERVREEMRKEDVVMRAMLRRGEIDDMLKPENKTPRYRELDAQFKKLVDAQREILVKNEFDRVYTTAGGSSMNAFTSTDMTAYHIVVPANKFELMLWMESERILRPVFREFYAERDVVFEERRMRTEATPTGRLEESFESLFWESHPYGWPTVGWPSDIPAISKKQADEFYSIYYAPQNITFMLGRCRRKARGEILWPHPARQGRRARRRDARNQAGRREAPLRRGRHQSERGHPVAHARVRPSRHLSAASARTDSLDAHRTAFQGTRARLEGRD